MIRSSLIILTVLCQTSLAQSLKLGDLAPPIEPYAWIKGAPVTGYEKGSAYVVEMGATWCKPCAVAIPKLTKLAEKYKGDVKVVGLFVKEQDVHKSGYLERIKGYVEKKGELMMYHVAADGPSKEIEKRWLGAMSMSRGVPQTFVIDKEGRMAGHFVGSNIKAVERLIDTIVEGSYRLEQQIDEKEKLNTTVLKYDHKKPLFVHGNGGDGSDFIFRSILTKAKENVKGSPDLLLESYFWIDTERWKKLLADIPGTYQKLDSVKSRYQTVNTTIPQLYQVAFGDTLDYLHPMTRWSYTGDYPDTTEYPRFKSAYGRHWREALIEVSDGAILDGQQKWNYALSVPKEKSTAVHLQKYIQEDLQRYFGYEVAVETRPMPCWFLKARPGVAEKLATITPGARYQSERVDSEVQSFFVFSNGDIRDFINLIHALNPYDDFPIIDKTGIPAGKIDYKLPVEYGDYYRNNDFEGYKKMLEEELGLYLEKGEKQMKVVVIRDVKEEL